MSGVFQPFCRDRALTFEIGALQAPLAVNGGFTIDGTGAVAAATSGDVTDYVAGVPLDSAGKVLVSAEGTFEVFGPGALPLSAEGFVNVTESDFERFYQGVPYSDDALYVTVTDTAEE